VFELASPRQRHLIHQFPAYRFFAIIGLIALLIIGSPKQASSQFALSDEKVNKDVTDIFLSIYNFEFDSAYYKIQHADIENGYESWYFFAASNIELWRMFAGELKSKAEKSYKMNLQRLLNNCDSLDNEKEQRFLRIMHYTYRTRLSMTNKDYIAAFKAISKYYDLLEPTFEVDGYPPYALIDGLYYYLYDYARDKYFLLRPFLAFYKNGDADKGLKYLKKAAKCPHQVISTEASYFLMKIYFDLEENPVKALPYATKLYNEFPGNFIFNFYYHRIRDDLERDYQTDLDAARKRVLKHAQLNEIQNTYFELLIKYRYP
jgi:hypothetical protein